MKNLTKKPDIYALVVKNTLLAITGVILVLIVSFRPIGLDNDSLAYTGEIAFYISNKGNVFSMYLEPSFYWICNVSAFFFSGEMITRGVFLIYAILGVFPKIVFLMQKKSGVLVAVFVYIGYFFILQEMTQIRVAVVSSIFLFSIEDIKAKKLSRYLLKILIALLFHRSAFILIPVFFIAQIKKIPKYFYYALPLVAISINMFLPIKSLIAVLLSSGVFGWASVIISKLEHYSTSGSAPMFTFFQVILLFLYYTMAHKFKNVNSIYFNIFSISIFIYYAFFSIPTLAIRTSEILRIVLLILIPDIVIRTKPQGIAYILAILTLSAVLFRNILVYF